MAKKIEVQGLQITIDKIKDEDYISLTDIAKRTTDTKPAFIIQRWLRNLSTLVYLKTWETVHNPKFDKSKMSDLFESTTDNRADISPKKFIKMTNSIGLINKAGRYGGGTYAHHEIALEFCTWLSPEFKVYFYKEWVQLKADDYNRRNLEFHIGKITDSIDTARAWLDTIPGQHPDRIRIGEEE